MTKDELKGRTKQFAINILKLLNEIPNNAQGYIVSKQLGRCSSSVGANYRAACRAKSKADFIAKIEIVEEEADESCYWLESLIEANILKTNETKLLLKEANELTAIFTATGKSTKENHPKYKK